MSAPRWTSVGRGVSVLTCQGPTSVSVTKASGASHNASQPVKVRAASAALIFLCVCAVCVRICMCVRIDLVMFMGVCVCLMSSNASDINECLDPNSCPNDQCENTPGSYECVPCLPGHQAQGGVCYGETQ